MTLSRQTTFAPIREIVARQVLPRLHRARRLPLRISCIGTARYDGLSDADGFDRTVVIGECPSPDDAMTVASQCVARGDVRLYLSEHTGDATPDTLIHLYVRDVDAVAGEFGVPVDEDGLAGRECELVDPDGNRLRVATRREG